MQDNNSYSIVDLTISLMVIFILLFIMMLNKTHQDFVNSPQQTRKNLVSALRENNIEATLEETDPLSVQFNLAEDKLTFKYNDYSLSPAGEQFLSSFIPEFANTICEGDLADSLQSVQIVGHTDSIASDEYNLELSQQRALEVMLYALTQTNLSEKHQECLFKLISVNGRGERELLPKGAVAGQENRAKSRRVEFKIRVKSFEEKQALLNQFKDS